MIINRFAKEAIWTCGFKVIQKEKNSEMAKFVNDTEGPNCSGKLGDKIAYQIPWYNDMQFYIYIYINA